MASLIQIYYGPTEDDAQGIPAVEPPAVLRVCGQSTLSEAGSCLASLLPSVFLAICFPEPASFILPEILISAGYCSGTIACAFRVVLLVCWSLTTGKCILLPQWQVDSSSSTS